jgi:HK97 family phage prohead protease
MEAAMQRRAYSFFDIKSVNDDKRIIRGVATTPTVDRVGDIVEPLGVKFKNPLPFLWQHQHDAPIGTVKFDKPTADGITFTAELPQIEEPGTLKDRVDEAWQSIKLGLVRAVSIGFRAVEYAFIEGTGGIRFTETEVFELSAVTIPANAEAVVTSLGKSMDAKTLEVIKSFDVGAKAAADAAEIQQAPASAATGNTVRVVKLNAPARVGAKPFVIRNIRRTG